MNRPSFPTAFSRWPFLFLFLVFSFNGKILAQPADTPTDTPTATFTFTNTPTPTNTPTATFTPTPTNTPTATYTPTLQHYSDYIDSTGLGKPVTAENDTNGDGTGAIVDPALVSVRKDNVRQWGLYCGENQYDHPFMNENLNVIPSCGYWCSVYPNKPLVKAGGYDFSKPFFIPDGAQNITVSQNVSSHAVYTEYINGVEVLPNTQLSSYVSTGANLVEFIFQTDGKLCNRLDLKFVINFSWDGPPLSPQFTPSPTFTPVGNLACHMWHSDPVDTLTGMPAVEIDDFNYNRPGFPMKFTRYYMKSVESPIQDLGRDWIHNYSMAIISPTSDFTQATVVQPNSVWTYNFSNGSYAPPAGSCDRLADLAEGTTTESTFLDNKINNSTKQVFKRLVLTDKFGTRHFFGVFGTGRIALGGWGSPIQYIARYLGSLDLYGNAIAMDYVGGTPGYYLGWTGQGGVPGTTAAMGTISPFDNVLPSRVSDSNNIWSIDFTYQRGRLSRVTNSVGDQIDFKWGGLHTTGTSLIHQTVSDPTAPVTQVLRSPSGFNADYVYSTDQYGDYNLVQKNDVLSEEGQKHISYLRNGPDGKRVAQILNGRGQVQHQYAYSVDSGNPGNVTTTIKDHLGATILVEHYQNGYWTGQDTYVNGTPHSEVYLSDVGGAVTQTTDGNSHATKITYDALWNPTRIEDAENNHWDFTYDSKSRILTSSDGNQKSKTYTYTTNQTQIAEPLGRTVNILHYSNGLVQQVDVNGQRPIQFTYDGNGNIQNVINPSPGGTTTYQIDSRGRLISLTDALFQPIQLEWDTNKDLLKKVTYPDSRSVSFGYDSNLNVNYFKDENLNATSYAYDADDNLTGVDAPGPSGAGDVDYTYDPLNRATSVDDHQNGPTTFVYNEQNLVISSTDDLGTVTYTYDGALNLKTKTERGITTTYDYYNNDRLKKLTFSDGTAPVSFAYDGDGNRTVMLDAEGTKNFLYDDLNRPVSIRNPAQGVTFIYGYNAFNDRTSLMSNKISGSFGYGYYNNYLLSSITDPENKTTNFYYNAMNLPTEITYGNGASTTFGYNPQNHRLTSLKHLNSTNEIISQYLYTLYDGVGNKKEVKDLVGTNTYNYDALSRLTSASYPGPRQTNSYGYDKVGNRTNLTLNGSSNTFTYSNGNKISAALGETFSHDGSGNMTQRSANSGTIYTWDALNRLVKVEKTSPSQAVSYIYDGFNRRVRKIDLTTGVTTNYAYDGLSVVLELDNNGGIKTVYNPSISATDSNGTKLGYLHDHLGNVTNLLDSKQNVVQSYVYDAFGSAIGIKSDLNKSRFVGGSDVDSDDDTNLQYMWNRWYDPKIGRFVSRDSIGFDGGINFYSYVENNPTNFIDPDGFNSLEPPPIPVPGRVPGNTWKWNPNPQNSRGGSWGPRIHVPTTTGAQPSASFEFTHGKGIDHWDVDLGYKARIRCDARGNYITAEEAHGVVPRNRGNRPRIGGVRPSVPKSIPKVGPGNGLPGGRGGAGGYSGSGGRGGMSGGGGGPIIKLPFQK
jgi:RHS repeat-associated protein